MSVAKLVSKCEEFRKFAQPNPKQFLQNLASTLFRIADYLPSVYAAKQLFEKMRIYNAEVQHSAQPKFQDVATTLKRFLTLLEFYRDHGPSYNIIIQENYRKPMNVYISNLQTLLQAKDFSQYRQFTLVRPGENAMIDLDEEQAKNSPYGY